MTSNTIPPSIIQRSFPSLKFHVIGDYLSMVVSKAIPECVNQIPDMHLDLTLPLVKTETLSHSVTKAEANPQRMARVLAFSNGSGFDGINVEIRFLHT
jgi:hypothetical protein